MDGNKCNDRGHHEFRYRNREPNLAGELLSIERIKCADCSMKATEYLEWGWVHPK